MRGPVTRRRCPTGRTPGCGLRRQPPRAGLARDRHRALALHAVGPSLWPSIRPRRTSTRSSRRPGRTATVTAEPAALEDVRPRDRADAAGVDAAALPAPPAELDGAPTTTRPVRLRWAPVPGAAGYRVYRNIYAAEPGRRDLGLPLGRGATPSTPSAFEDGSICARRPTTTRWSRSTSRNRLRAVTRSVAALSTRDARRRARPSARTRPAGRRSSPLALHPLGTDYLGRDLLARLMHGARVIAAIIGFVRAAARARGRAWSSAAWPATSAAASTSC